MAIVPTVSSLAKKTEDSTVGTGKACSDKESRENKCNHYKPTTTMDRVCAKVQFICNEGRL